MDVREFLEKIDGAIEKGERLLSRLQGTPGMSDSSGYDGPPGHGYDVPPGAHGYSNPAALHGYDNAPGANGYDSPIILSSSTYSSSSSSASSTTTSEKLRGRKVAQLEDQIL